MTTAQRARRAADRTPLADRAGTAGGAIPRRAAFWLASYAGLIIPVIGVGVLSGVTGTFTAVLVFSVLLAALCLYAISRFARDAAVLD